VSPRFALRRVGAVLVAVAVLAGCAGSPSSDTTTSTKTTSDLTAIKVTGDPDAKPALNIPKPFAVPKTTRRLLSTGSGGTVTVGEAVTIQYVGVNGTDGKEFDTSYGKSGKATFTLDDKQIIKGFVTGLTGVAVGSRVLLAIPPVDGYGTSGQPSVGIGPTDTLVFVIDVKSASEVLKRATGTPVKPQAGLPKVTLNKTSGEPTITVPKTAPPKGLVVRTLIQGKGAKILKGQTITVHYTGVIYATGKVFDSSWAKKAPVPLAIGSGQVIAGWDEGLVGKQVGSQILLVIPPDKGYGATGQPSAGIKGTDTLVFVVDLLQAS